MSKTRKNFNVAKVNSMLDRMISELTFLWRDAQEQVHPELKERKLKQYNELNKIYRKQRLFFIKMAIK